MCSDPDIHSTCVRAKRCISSYQNNVYVVLVEITKDNIQTLPAMGSTEYIVLVNSYCHGGKFSSHAISCNRCGVLLNIK